MPGWIDNAFHSHGKRELVPVAVDGVLMRAISRACDLMSDGFVETSWLHKQLRPHERRRVLELAVQHRLLEPLAAGETRRLRGAARAGLRREPITVTVGPSDVDGYLVHDFLDCNRARSEVEARRRSEADRKRQQRRVGRQEPLPWDVAAAGVPPGQDGVSRRTMGGDSRDRVVQPPFEEELQSDARAAASSSDPALQSVLDVLAAAPRLHIDAVGVENAVRAFPAADPVRAAREVVTLGTDPAWRITNAARLLWKALEQQRPGGPAAPFAGRRNGRATPADFQAFKDVPA